MLNPDLDGYTKPLNYPKKIEEMQKNNNLLKTENTMWEHGIHI